MSKLSSVWVLSDMASRLPELVAGGLKLGEKVSALVIGSVDDVNRAFSYGVSSVYYLGEKSEGIIFEDYALTIVQAMAKDSQPALVLLPATKRGKAMAAKLGAMLNAGVVNDASDVTIEGDQVKAKHMVFGGLAIGEEKVKSPTAIVTVGNGVFEPALSNGSFSGEKFDVDFIAPKVSIQCIKRLAKQGGSVDLGKAKRVVGVGRGIAKQEDIKIAEELCAALGAELGCSRPIAEGEKWMERDRYVGVSGVMLKPDLYLALGISGQIQHMVGANGAQIIVAVNKDKNAPIFQYADFGLVGDLYKVVPALVSALKS